MREVETYVREVGVRRAVSQYSVGRHYRTTLHVWSLLLMSLAALKYSVSRLMHNGGRESASRKLDAYLTGSKKEGSSQGKLTT